MPVYKLSYLLMVLTKVVEPERCLYFKMSFAFLNDIA